MKGGDLRELINYSVISGGILLVLGGGPIANTLESQRLENSNYISRGSSRIDTTPGPKFTMHFEYYGYGQSPESVDTIVERGYLPSGRAGGFPVIRIYTPDDREFDQIMPLLNPRD